MKHKIVYCFVFLILPNHLNSQGIYGEFIGFSDTLHIRINNTVELKSFSEKNGIIKDSLIIFDTDTLILKKYHETRYFYLLPLKYANSCSNASYRAYYLRKEYWSNGNVKCDISVKYFSKKGMVYHGESVFYNEDGTVKEIHKYRNGKRL